MSANRSNFFYRRLTSLTASFKDNAFDFKFSSRHLKIAVIGGDLEFVINGADDNQVDGLIKSSDGLVSFIDFEANRIALRQASGAVTEVRVWANK